MVFDWYPDDLGMLMPCDDRAESNDKTVAVLTRNEGKHVLIRVLLGLCILHQRGLIHNDVKPNNILLKHYQHEQRHRDAVLADLGLVRCTTVSLATSMRRRRRHIYDAPDPHFSTKIDLWSFALVALHLTFVTNTKNRMLSEEFDLLILWSNNQNFNAIRNFVTERLKDEDPFFVESLVQCLHIDPKYRPTAMLMHEILTGGKLYTNACRIATILFTSICSHDICIEEMIFPHWYQSVFLQAIGNSKKISREVMKIFEDLAKSQDFPLMAAIDHCDSEMRQLIVNVLTNAFKPAPSA